jgi:hypothetical protein
MLKFQDMSEVEFNNIIDGISENDKKMLKQMRNGDIKWKPVMNTSNAAIYFGHRSGYKNYGIYYHSTYLENAKKIIKTGFKLPEINSEYKEVPAIYLSTDILYSDNFINKNRKNITFMCYAGFNNPIINGKITNSEQPADGEKNNEWGEIKIYDPHAIVIIGTVNTANEKNLLKLDIKIPKSKKSTSKKSTSKKSTSKKSTSKKSTTKSKKK